MKTIYFIRHGQTDSNSTGAQQGPAEPLNTIGLRQAATVAERTKHLPIERVITSSMTRAEQTGEAIAAALDLSYETSDLLRELAIPTELQGALPDPDPEAPINKYMKGRVAYADDPTWRFADGENFQDLIDRIAAALAFLAEQPEDHIAVVSHGRFLRALAGYVVTAGTCSGADVETFSNTLKVTNTGIAVLQYDKEQWKLLTWNDMAHLAE